MEKSNALRFKLHPRQREFFESEDKYVLYGVGQPSLTYYQNIHNLIQSQIYESIMANFRVTQDDINRSKLVEPGLWYRYRIVKVYDEVSKGEDKSMNTKVDCRIVGSPFNDLLVTITFNEKAPGRVIPFLRGLGIEVEADANYNLGDNLEGREFMGFTGHREWQSRKFNDIQDYRPVEAAE